MLDVLMVGVTGMPELVLGGSGGVTMGISEGATLKGNSAVVVVVVVVVATGTCGLLVK